MNAASVSSWSLFYFISKASLFYISLKQTRILRINSSGSFLNLPDNLLDLFTVISRLWPCLVDLELLIFVEDMIMAEI